MTTTTNLDSVWINWTLQHICTRGWAHLAGELPDGRRVICWGNTTEPLSWSKCKVVELPEEKAAKLGVNLLAFEHLVPWLQLFTRGENTVKLSEHEASSPWTTESLDNDWYRKLDTISSPWTTECVPDDWKLKLDTIKRRKS
jgi:hypothetical protein